MLGGNLVNKKVLYLVGSPKKQKSASMSFINYIKNNIDNNIDNKESDTVYYIYELVNNSEKYKEFTSKLLNADCVFCAYPIYCDTLPSPVIEFLEMLYKDKNIKDNEKGKNIDFTFIANCGFYEAEQVENSLNVCKSFCKHMGFNFKLGLEVGQGPLFENKVLKRNVFPNKNITILFDEAIDIVFSQKGINPINNILKCKPVFSQKAYLNMGNFGFYLIAIKNKALRKLKDKPYCEC